MKKVRWPGLLALILAAAGAYGYVTYSQSQPINQASITHTIIETKTPLHTPGDCNQSLWNRVYNPHRLKIMNQCMTVTGKIEVTRIEKDSDYHILLKLDPEYQVFLTQANFDHQRGDLVLEPICQNRVTQTDAVDACKNYAGPYFTIPSAGAHVKVTGSYVLDHEHGDWAEIHPVTSIEVLPN